MCIRMAVARVHLLLTHGVIICCIECLLTFPLLGGNFDLIFHWETAAQEWMERWDESADAQDLASRVFLRPCLIGKWPGNCITRAMQQGALPRCYIRLLSITFTFLFIFRK